MRFVLSAILLSTVPAFGWEFDAREPVALPADITGLAIAPMGRKDVVLALGEEATWIVDPEFGEIVRTLDRGGVAAARIDADMDGRKELVVCGASGLWAIPWEGRYGGDASLVDGRACAAVVAVRSPGGAYLVAAGAGWVSAYEGTSRGLERANEVLFTPETGMPLLAGGPDQVAYATVGGTAVQVYDPAGTTSLPSVGAIGDLAWARDTWTWTLPDTYAVHDALGRETPVPDVGRLLTFREQLLVVGDGVSTWLTGAEVEAIATPAGPSHAALARVTDDACADVVVATAREVLALVGRCAEPEVVEVAPAAPILRDPPEPRLSPPRQSRRRMVMGVEVPSFLGYEQVSRRQRSPRQQYLVVGSGWAMGATLGPTDVQIPFFPALAMGYEVGGPRVRFFAGVDSAALFFWIRPDGRGGGIHLANATVGATFGSPTLRAGPILTAGILNYGAGLRTVLTPWTAGGSNKGIEARLTVFGPSTGEVMILYVWSQPSRRRTESTFQAAREPVSERSDLPALAKVPGKAEPVRARGKTPICGEFSVGAGLAASISSTVYSWSFVGANNRVALGGSPALALSCSTGLEPRRPVALHLGMETAPFLRYYLYQGGSTGTDRLSHFGTLSIAPMVGSPRFAVGPLGVAGIWELGAGVRSVLGLHTDRQGLRHQLELRAWGLYKGAPAGEIALLYGVAWDPWKRPSFRDD